MNRASYSSIFVFAIFGIASLESTFRHRYNIEISGATVASISGDIEIGYCERTGIIS
jgi:hypothetical protein